VPVSATVCGLLGALSRMVRIAERAALRFGRNVIVTVQEAFGARPAPPIGQLLVWGNRAAFGPPMKILLNSSGTVPLLVMVTVCGALIVLIGTLPNAREAVESVATERAVVPVRLTVVVTAPLTEFPFWDCNRTNVVLCDSSLFACTSGHLDAVPVQT
jgi:hypothetical protein